jgi:hypothetical protein
MYNPVNFNEVPMRITEVLKEDANEAIRVFQSLSPLHVAVLKRVNSGDLDPLNASDRVQGVLDDLLTLNLLDNTYDVTPSGLNTLRIASKVETGDLRDARKKAAARRAMNQRNSEPDVDVDVELDGDDEVVGDEIEDTPEEELGGTLAKPKKVKKKDRVKALRRDDFRSFDRDDARSVNDDGEYNWN